VFNDVIKQSYSYGILREARRGDDHSEDQAERVGDDASLAANDLLRRIDSLAGKGNVGGGLHALGVDHARRRFGLAALFDAGQASQVVVESGEDSAVTRCTTGLSCGASTRTTARPVRPRSRVVSLCMPVALLL